MLLHIFLSPKSFWNRIPEEENEMTMATNQFAWRLGLFHDVLNMPSLWQMGRVKKGGKNKKTKQKQNQKKKNIRFLFCFFSFLENERWIKGRGKNINDLILAQV